MISLCLSSLLIYLTSQGVVKIRFSIDDMWHQILFAKFVVCFTIITVNASLVTVRVIMNDTFTECNMMSITPMISWSVLLYSVLMGALMIIVKFVITFSAVKVINQIVQTKKDVEAISGINSGTSDTRKGDCKFLIVVVIVKAILLLPYPLLQVVSLLGLNISGHAYQYVTVAFITLESFYNSIVFVFRPLMTQQRIKTFRFN